MNQNNRPQVVTYPENYVRKKKVAIIGTASRTLKEVPWDNPEFNFWGLAWRNKEEFSRFDRVFECHPKNITEEKKVKGHENYPALLRDRNESIPIVVLEPNPLVPNATIYPRHEVNNMLKAGFEDQPQEYYSVDYYASSIAYMFALAMYEGYEEIHIYGVDLLDVDEYQFQRPCQDYLIGLARGRGIKVYVPQKSALVKAPFIYGIEDKPWKKDQLISWEGLEKKKAVLEQKKQEMTHALSTIDGALQIINEQILYYERAKQGTKLPDYGSEG